MSVRSASAMRSAALPSWAIAIASSMPYMDPSMAETRLPIETKIRARNPARAAFSHPEGKIHSLTIVFRIRRFACRFRAINRRS